MADLSMLTSAFVLGVDPSASIIAKVQGLKWPPPPTISMRAILHAQAIQGFSAVLIDPGTIPGGVSDPDPCVPAVGNQGSPSQLPFDYRFRTDEQAGFVASLHQFALGQEPLGTLSQAVFQSLNYPTISFTPALVNAFSQLAVTGRQSFSKFAKNPPQDADLVAYMNSFFSANPDLAPPDPTILQSAAHDALDIAYQTLWAIRANDPGWRSFRSTLGWLAVFNADDTPHRPVNVPTAPYPQFDISFDVSRTDNSTFGVTTRYMVASAGTFVGPVPPNDSTSYYRCPAVALNILPAPQAPFSATPAPRTIPPETPFVPPGNKIIIYVHGGGSRAEEAVNMANWLIIEGAAVGEAYSVISFDLPNSAYASPFDVTDVVGPVYHPSLLHILTFEKQFVINFIEALDQKIGHIKDRIVAVMGGSLGGNISLLLSSENDDTHAYLNTIVAWSPTCAIPSSSYDILSHGLLAAYYSGLKDQATSPEGPPEGPPGSMVDYISNIYDQPLNPGPPSSLPPFIPPQPRMWYRAGWEPCKQQSIDQSKYDRLEVYSDKLRHWTSAIDLEQVYYSFQDHQRYSVIASAQGSHLLLAAGDMDNYASSPIYNSTLDVAKLMKTSAHCRAEFWKNTGHSFHTERPHLFAKEIVDFLKHLYWPGSPYGIPMDIQNIPGASDSDPRH